VVNYSITGALITNANVILVGIGIAGSVHLIFGGAGGALSSVVLNRIRYLQLPNYKLKREKTEK
jgi:hypothetical protein